MIDMDSDRGKSGVAMFVHRIWGCRWNAGVKPWLQSAEWTERGEDERFGLSVSVMFYKAALPILLCIDSDCSFPKWLQILLKC